ncbi:MAG: hypothetical protein JXA82_12755 [Sedimentisphaerales bacterium]|nr:hypothetical protein [Sedimentisphaerales bacterium]
MAVITAGTGDQGGRARVGACRGDGLELAFAIGTMMGSRILGIERGTVCRWIRNIRNEIEDGTMSILVANLRHLRQRRSLWVIYVFVLFIAGTYLAGLMQHPEAGQGRFIGLILLASVAGLVTASLQVEILTRPFAFTLPNHRHMLRWFLFLSAVAVNLPCAFLFLAYPDLSVLSRIGAVAAAFFAGHISFWIGAAIVFLGRNSAAFMGFFPVVILLGALFSMHVYIEQAIVHYPVVTIFCGAFVNTIAWLMLGTEDLLRRYCDKLWLGVLDVWNIERQKEYARARRQGSWEKLPAGSRWIEQGMLHRIQVAPIGMRRTLLAQLYATFGLGAVQLKRPLFGLLLITLTICGLGYFGSSARILFFMPALIIAQLPLPIYSSLLTAGGRKERFYSSLLIVAILGVLVTCVVTAIAAITKLLAGAMPAFDLAEATFSFTPLTPRLWYIPLAMTPVVFTLNLLCVRKPVMMMVGLILFFMLMMSGGMFWQQGLYRPFSTWLVVAMLLCCWGLFLTILRWVSRRHTLAGQ